MLHEAYGLADIEATRSMTAVTGFDIGSITKLFTAAAVVELEADRLVALDDPLRRFFPAAPPDKAEITLGQLVRHTSGLADLVGPGGSIVTEYDPDEFDYVLVERDEFVERVLASEMRFPPGAQRQYSNAGYGLLGAIIELASGLPYERYVRERVLVPAGLDRTGYVGPEWRPDELAVGYRGGERWGTALERPSFPDGPSWNLRAGGGFLSTAGDVFRWMAALEAGAVLSSTARATYLDEHVRRSARGTRVHGFAGSNAIFTASLLWDLDVRVIVVIVTSIAEKSALDLWRELAPLVLPARE